MTAHTFGWRLWWSAILSLHSGRPEPPVDLTDPAALAASSGVVGLLDIAAAVGLRGSA